MRNITLNLNSQPFECAPGSTLLDAIRNAGIELPALCHDPRIKPSGSCRLCLVEIEGCSNPVAACLTPASDGLVIRTHTSELEAGRKMTFAMLAAKYPDSAIDQWPDKIFHRWLQHYGIAGCALQATPVDDSHPYIQVDMSRCIYCFRCVRICAELQGQFVWSIRNRGTATQIVPDKGLTFGSSSCVACGACVDTCPTGALEDKQAIDRPRSTSWVRTTCPYCGTGCEMVTGAAENRIVSIRPVLDAPVSHGHLCVKGRYAFDYVHAADRITHPMIRRDGSLQTVTWEDATRHVAAELIRIRERYGPDAIGVLGSARATNEENYITQKFARVVLGTNNVDCCARVCHAPTAAAMGLMLGTGTATNSYDDIEIARTIFLLGTNATENHPIIGARIKQATLSGAQLIVVDPRRIELARYATIHLPVRPGTNVALLNAMAYVLIEEDLIDAQFIATRVDEFNEFRSFIRTWSPENAAAICGVDAELIQKAARMYATAKPSMAIHGLGMTEHSQGTEGVMCLVNLALLTGNLGKPGTGVNPLRGQNNVQGSAHMGCEPAHLPGYEVFDRGAELFERAWEAGLPRNRGKNLLDMMDAAENGELRALYAIGYDILLTNANEMSTRRALSKLDLVVVQDMFLNETAKEFATVFLPAASSFEKDGTFMNAERRVRKVIDPIGDSLSDWEIICDVAKAMECLRGFSFRSAEEIWDEVRSVWSAGAGMSYQRLDSRGLQWPCPSEDHPGTPILHTESFAGAHRASLARVNWRTPLEAPSDDFPILLTTGRLLYQFNAGTMTARTPNITWRQVDSLDLSPEDAKRFSVDEGERVRAVSCYGAAELPVHISDSLRLGEAFATFHSPDVLLNRITGGERDSITATPQYKVTAIRIEKLQLSK